MQWLAIACVPSWASLQNFEVDLIEENFLPLFAPSLFDLHIGYLLSSILLAASSFYILYAHKHIKSISVF
jgi:hypothetical protein